jgi:WS/DGAT/MGAT family acyltransferase
MHHSMTDGVGGIGLMWLFTDSEPLLDSPFDPRSMARPSTKSGRRNPLASATSLVAAASTDPVAAMRAAPKFARSTIKILAPAPHSLSELTTGRGLDRHLDVLNVPLHDLERAGHAVDGSVNDAFMAAIVGGLRRYHVAHGERPSSLRVTMPISVRRDGDEAGGNRFTPARFVVPLEIEDPVLRMEALGKITREWRHEPAVGMTDVLATTLSHLPSAVTTSLFGSMLKGVDFVATNVPGSRDRCWLAGAEVLEFYGFGPPSGSALSVALVSHVDSCCIGINVDTAAIDDPDLLRTSLEEGFAEVVAVGRAGRRRRHTERTAHHARPVAAVPAPLRLSALDASFLEAETSSTPMHIGALMLLEGAPLRDDRGRLRMTEIRSAITAKLPLSPRMRQVAVQVPYARPAWEEAVTFDIADHVRHVRLPRPGTRAQLETLCCELQMKVLDRTRPLWEMWFVDGLADGAVGLVYKVHHAVVDGVSAAETFELLLGHGNLPAPASQPPEGQVRRLVPAVVADTVASAGIWVKNGARLATAPTAAASTVMGLMDLIRPSALAPHTSLNSPIGGNRRLVPVSFDLAELKAVAHSYGVTLNDVLLALVGAGIGELFAGRGDRHDHVQVLVPMSLRRDGEHNGAGNRVGALIVPVAIGRDPVAALRTIATSTRSRKAGPEVAALDLLMRTSDTWPVGLLGPASRQIVHHQPFVNLVVTNVRGSDQPLSLLGARITEIVPIVPLGGNLSLGIAALSYAGKLVVGLNVDADACSDVDVLARGIESAFAQLRASSPQPAPRRRRA